MRGVGWAIFIAFVAALIYSAVAGAAPNEPGATVETTDRGFLLLGNHHCMPGPPITSVSGSLIYVNLEFDTDTCDDTAYHQWRHIVDLTSTAPGLYSVEVAIWPVIPYGQEFSFAFQWNGSNEPPPELPYRYAIPYFRHD